MDRSSLSQVTGAAFDKQDDLLIVALVTLQICKFFRALEGRVGNSKVCVFWVSEREHGLLLPPRVLSSWQCLLLGRYLHLMLNILTESSWQCTYGCKQARVFYFWTFTWPFRCLFCVPWAVCSNTYQCLITRLFKKLIFYIKTIYVIFILFIFWFLSLQGSCFLCVSPQWELKTSNFKNVHIITHLQILQLSETNVAVGDLGYYHWAGRLHFLILKRQQSYMSYISDSNGNLSRHLTRPGSRQPGPALARILNDSILATFHTC